MKEHILYVLYCTSPISRYISNIAIGVQECANNCGCVEVFNRVHAHLT
jgi:hypothetical protein